MNLRIVAFAATLLGFATQAGAVPLVPTSYDMPNGLGVASGGTFNYWDLDYTGSGATTQDGAPLSGGLGDLTDGVIASDNWFDVENAAGTGPYVGWCNCGPTPILDSLIAFDFTPDPLTTLVFDRVVLNLDDSNGAGGVDPPSKVVVEVVGHLPVEAILADPASGDPFAFTVELGGLSGSQVRIQLFHANLWVFLSEVTFDGEIIRDVAVPEPPSLAFVVAAVAALAVVRRRRISAACYSSTSRGK